MEHVEELLAALKSHVEQYPMGYDAGYHARQLIRYLEEELSEEE